MDNNIFRIQDIIRFRLTKIDFYWLSRVEYNKGMRSSLQLRSNTRMNYIELMVRSMCIARSLSRVSRVSSPRSSFFLINLALPDLLQLLLWLLGTSLTSSSLVYRVLLPLSLHEELEPDPSFLLDKEGWWAWAFCLFHS